MCVYVYIDIEDLYKRVFFYTYSYDILLIFTNSYGR